jgi:tRNA(fMet)-specific endonuclease VapC
MTFALDSNTIIFALRQTGSRAETEVRARKRSELVVPSMVRAELLHGALRSSQPARELSKVEGFLRFIKVIDFDRAAARHYAEIKRHLESIGQLIGPNDLVIAATVRAHGSTLVTNNANEFNRVPELLTVDWS